MSTTDEIATPARPETVDARYGELSIDDDEFVIYDRENHQAWLQSTTAVDLSAHR